MPKAAERPNIVINGKAQKARYATNSQYKACEFSRTLTNITLIMIKGGHEETFEIVSPINGETMTITQLVDGAKYELDVCVPNALVGIPPKALCEIVGINPDSFDSVGTRVNGTDSLTFWGVDFNDVERDNIVELIEH